MTPPPPRARFLLLQAATNRSQQVAETIEAYWQRIGAVPSDDVTASYLTLVEGHALFGTTLFDAMVCTMRHTRPLTSR
jgi:hypothetical protein